MPLYVSIFLSTWIKIILFLEKIISLGVFVFIQTLKTNLEIFFPLEFSVLVKIMTDSCTFLATYCCHFFIYNLHILCGNRRRDLFWFIFSLCFGLIKKKKKRLVLLTVLKIIASEGSNMIAVVSAQAHRL